jgi:signal transduction histidine kinase/AraC-like DNA-binding protein
MDYALPGYCILLLLLVVGCSEPLPVDNQTETAAAELCVLDAPGVNYRLVDYVSVLSDSGAVFTIDEVTRPGLQPAFQPYRAYSGRIDPQRTYWGRFRVVNRLPDAARNTEWVLYFSGSWTDLTVYTTDSAGQWVAEPNGSFLPVREKRFSPTTKGNLVKLLLPPGKIETVYFRGKGSRAALPPSYHLYLQTTEVFYDKLVKAKVGNAIFIGFLGMILLYNLIVYFFGRDRSFIYYSAYLLMMIVYAAYSSDDLSDWLGDRLFAMHPEYYGFFKLSIFIGLMFYLAFIRRFADLKQLLPGWDRAFKLLIYLGFPLMAIYVMVAISSNFSYVLEDRITVTYIALVIGSCCVLLYPLYRSHDKKGYFVFAGIAAISLGCLLSLLTRVAIPPFTLLYLKGGVILEVLIFSVGLAYRQRNLLLARKQAEFALRESRLVQERQQLETDRLQELTDFKTRFYTNITHEFRTPLTVIMGVSGQIKGHAEEKKLIERNGKNLLSLINRLLDLSKLASGTVRPDWVHDDIVAYLGYLTESFYSAAEQKKIRFMFYSEDREIMMDYDEDMVLRVVNNLISNALKFTPEAGKVIVHASRIKTDEGPLLRLIVKDDGVGISKDDQERIFDRFYQAQSGGHASAVGTGVGLTLTKELTELMQGSITVSSELGAGSEFMVSLPIRDSYYDTAPEPPPTASATDYPQLLVIEDSRDIVTYLRSLLADRYQLHHATNGAAGIEKALELVPDIIITDLMMPKKDGYEVCAALKSDERTSHVPIIFLTANTTPAAKIEALRYGADAYLTKPFNKQELEIRLQKLIETRRQLQLRYANPNPEEALPDKDAPPSPIEDAFILKLHQLIQDHLDDADFGVSALAAAAFLSQMQLYRKLKAITGKTPSRFIRSYRLRQGMAMLKQGDRSVSEVAYAVGFTDPSYFSRTFHQEFSHNPSHYLKS